jgi:hypothetical protein
VKTAALVDYLLAGSGSGRDAAHRSLSWLMGYQGARSASLWTLGGDAAILELGAFLDEDALVAARQAVVENRVALASGQPCAPHGSVVIPTTVGTCCLYMEDVALEQLDLPTARAVAAAAARALRRGVPPRLVDPEWLRCDEPVGPRRSEWAAADSLEC